MHVSKPRTGAPAPRTEQNTQQNTDTRADPFLRKTLSHFRWQVPPSLSRPGFGARASAPRGSLAPAAFEALNPGRVRREGLIPRNHTDQLRRLKGAAQTLFARADAPLQTIGEKISALLEREIGLTEDFNGQRVMVIPC